MLGVRSSPSKGQTGTLAPRLRDLEVLDTLEPIGWFP